MNTEKLCPRCGDILPGKICRHCERIERNVREGKLYVVRNQAPDEAGMCRVCSIIWHQKYMDRHGRCYDCRVVDTEVTQLPIINEPPGEWRLQFYGITGDEWKELLEKQDYKCGCCRTENPGIGGRWHTDHDHRLERVHGIVFVRGILCASCNASLTEGKLNLTLQEQAYLNDPPGGLYGINIDKVLDMF